MIINSWLPYFSGFYETWWNCSQDEESELDYINEQRKEKGFKAIKHAPDWNIDFKDMSDTVGKFYCNYMQNILKENGYKILIKYEEMRSPKYYNYETDSINCTYIMKTETYKKIMMYIRSHMEDFNIYIKDHYTSCSGFISSYSNIGSEWLINLELAIDNIDLLSHRMGSIIKFMIYMFENDFYTENSNINEFSNEFDLNVYYACCDHDYYISNFITTDYNQYINYEIPEDMTIKDLE